MTTTTDSLAGLIYHAAEHLDPQHQTPCWPDPIGWDGRPLAEQATDLCVLLDARAADGDDRADELAEDLRRTVAQLQIESASGLDERMLAPNSSSPSSHPCAPAAS